MYILHEKHGKRPTCEHAWDMLQKAISSRQVQPATVRELRGALIEEWAQLPQHKLRRLIGSMRRRCQAVINAHGHAINSAKTQTSDFPDFQISASNPKNVDFRPLRSIRHIHASMNTYLAITLLKINS